MSDEKEPLTVQASYGETEDKCIFCESQVDTCFDQICWKFGVRSVCDECVASGPDGIKARTLEAAKLRLANAQKRLAAAEELQGEEIILPDLHELALKARREYRRMAKISKLGVDEIAVDDIPF